MLFDQYQTDHSAKEEMKLENEAFHEETLEERFLALNQRSQQLEEQYKEALRKADRAEKALAAREKAFKRREDELIKELQNMTFYYTAILNSESWKITKPLRVIVPKVKNVCRSNKVLYACTRRVKTFLMEDIAAMRDNLRRKREQRTKFEKDILFSILVPLYNTPQNFLEEMIGSVQSQTYAKWELCLVDGSDREHGYVEEVCRLYAQKDPRIKYKKLLNNEGISENTNAAIEMATGHYIGLLDHDDLLHPSALFEYMKVICRQDADVIYCDEDKFGTVDGVHFGPNHKPDFSIDYLRNNNYICHFLVFKKELLDKVGLFRKQCDGSQDHDMILRLTEVTDKIAHVPHILYHWRASDTSVAFNPDAKPYSAEAGILAINEHLQRCGLKGKAESSVIHPNVYRVRYEIEGDPMVSILIPNKDHVEDLSRCIDSILSKSTYKNYEIIIVENNSEEQETFDYYQEIESNPLIRVVVYETKGGFNYSAINNFGMQFARGEHILLLNNDVEIITENWIEEMLMFSQREDVGAVGAKLYYPNDTLQHAGVILGIGGVADHAHKNFPREAKGYMMRCWIQQNLSAVTAACLMTKRSVFEEVGGQDEESFKVALNDVHLCMKGRDKGYLIVWTPYAEAYHHESKSRGAEDTPEKVKRFEGEILAFRKKWKKELASGDPYYNPNLALDSTDFRVRIQ